VTDLFRAFVLIAVGLSGDAEHGALFQKWGATLASASETLGVPAERILYLGDQTTKQTIEQAFATLATRASADDVVVVVLIGHGSFDGKEAKFNLRGPDMSGADFAAQLRRLPVKRTIFVNTASASGPFVQALSAPGRTIITATRSGAEQYATLFGGFFVNAFTSDVADGDKNGRITIQEAFEYGQREVARAYEREGLLATEHAVIDDGAKVASVFALGTVGAGEALPADPALRALHLERRELEQRMEALKVLKGSMDPARYESELERLATTLALKTREIRQLEAKP